MKILAASFVALGLLAGAAPAANAAGVAIRVGNVGVGVGHARYHHHSHWYHHRRSYHHHWHH